MTQDVIVARLGADHSKRLITQRLVEVNNGEDTIRLLTDRLDLPSDLVAFAYRYRWNVELFFRWLKCVLGCRHLLGESLQAVQIQVYAALIASLLLVAWTHKNPNKPLKCCASIFLDELPRRRCHIIFSNFLMTLDKCTNCAEHYWAVGKDRISWIFPGWTPICRPMRVASSTGNLCP